MTNGLLLAAALSPSHLFTLQRLQQTAIWALWNTLAAASEVLFVFIIVSLIIYSLTDSRKGEH